MQLEILGFILLIIVLHVLTSPFLKRGVLGCGLVGFSGNNNYDMTYIKFLLYWNSVERTSLDATGIFTPRTGVKKNNIRAELFITDSKEIGKIKPDSVLIGHVRAKTVGTNTALNAHPFEYSRIVGVHNGTLKNHYELIQKYNMNSKKIDVDSQALINGLNEDFLHNKDNNFNILDKYYGAAALLFFDKEERILYACHDKERPLFYGYVNKTEMYISSEKESLEAINCLDVKPFPINIVHKIKNGEIVGKFPYTPYTPPVVNIHARIGSFNDIRWDGDRIVIDPDIKGFSPTACDAEMFIGYNMRIDFNNAYNHGLWYNDWYFCKAIKEGSKASLDKLVLVDSHDKDVIAEKSWVDNTNFIPVKGCYVKLLVDLVSKKDSNKKVASKNIICLVEEHTYGDPKVTIIHPETKKELTINVCFVRNLTHVEFADFQNFVKQQQIKAEVEKSTIDLTKHEEDYPFIDTTDEDTPIDNTAESQDILIPYDLYSGILDEIRTRLNNVDKLVDENKLSEAKKSITELVGEINQAYDVSCILTSNIC